MALASYARKRDFTKTPEPAAKKKKKSSSEGFVFCVQEHHARRLHYDFRIEWKGVLKSWAVPKGVPTKFHEKRLAIEVEDHPLDYARFEGIIPEGYGKGQVILWDYGHWQPLNDPRQGLKEGRLNFSLNGDRLRGSWSLIRLKPKNKKEKKQWLLIKQDQVESAPMSDSKGFTKPQLALLSESAPAGEDWIHEIKYDGYRSLAHLDHGKIKIFTRNGIDWTERYAQLQTPLAKIKAEEAWVDGEITCVDEHGRSSFSLLQNALEKRSSPLVYYVFDLLSSPWIIRTCGRFLWLIEKRF